MYSRRAFKIGRGFFSFRTPEFVRSARRECRLEFVRRAYRCTSLICRLHSFDKQPENRSIKGSEVGKGEWSAGNVARNAALDWRHALLGVIQ